MRRLQLFEFEDLPRFPDRARSAMIAVLGRAHRFSGMATALAPAFSQALAAAPTPTVLDIASGGGGPVTLLLEALEAAGDPLPRRVLLTDLYPRVEDWALLQRRWPDRLGGVEAPVDGTRLPAELEGGLITAINALHHFPPEAVRSLFAQVVDRGSALFVAEAFPRSLLRSSAYLPALLRALPEGSRQLRHQGLGPALLLHPLVLLAGMWDHLASTLRMHRPEELLALTRELAPHYRWGHGLAPYPPWGMAWFFYGVPPGRDAR